MLYLKAPNPNRIPTGKCIHKMGKYQPCVVAFFLTCAFYISINSVVQKNPKLTFKKFLESFPEVALPIVLSDEAHHDFSKSNDPLHPVMIEQHLGRIEDGFTDDLTEYEACFKIPKTFDFHAIVYWKAGLMSYQYVLATFEKNGEFIDKRVIAGTYSDGKTVTKSVATIDEDLTIHIVTGQLEGPAAIYDASSSTSIELELLTDGKIAHSV